VVAELSLVGRSIAAVTAGWQEREDEDEELDRCCGGSLHNLRLYSRLLDVFTDDPELAMAWRKHQRTMIEVQDLYRLRLGHAIEAIRDLQRRRSSADSRMVEPELDGAFASVRALDAEHLERLQLMRHDFDSVWLAATRPALARARKRVAEELEGVAAVVVAGGHVAVLLNRMRLLGVAEGLVTRPVIAWSAGAMVLGRRVVLFHDHPPQGAGNAEVLENGLDLYRGLVPFPDTRRRLASDQVDRVELLARRFAPDLCMTLDGGARAERTAEGWNPLAGARIMGSDGQMSGEVAE
jgi:hypothetical protein